eukprot:TRINITY_DN8282_c0_g1_i1.p1 TRINITY_DN8282_c0_g1~~TRINITY_DN8282_c0_g1_i1.p1  ORF type:complete len:425 (+),score=63.74 TRINITY_DN8282_c0_g1_i1:228-1502(+)
MSQESPLDKSDTAPDTTASTSWESARRKLQSTCNSSSEPSGPEGCEPEQPATTQRSPAGSVIVVQIVHTDYQDSHTTYGVRVESEEGTWTVSRRYSQFRALRDSLVLAFSQVKAVEFPGKRLFGSTADHTVDTRRLQLERWLVAMVKEPAICASQGLQLFLQASESSRPQDAEISGFKAAIRGDTARVRQLIRDGWDVNSANPSGLTALHFAATYGRLSVLRTLLAVGASTSVRDHQGKTAVQLATTPRVAAYIRAVSSLMTMACCGEQQLNLSVVEARVLKHRILPNEIQFRVEVQCGGRQWTFWRDEHSFQNLHDELLELDQLPERPLENPLKLSMKVSNNPPVRRLYPEGAHKPVPALPANRMAWKDSNGAVGERCEVLSEWLGELSTDSTRVGSLPLLDFIDGLVHLGQGSAQPSDLEMF